MSTMKYMNLAIQKAFQGIDKKQTPFGACIVMKGKVISCVHNQVWKLTDITAHAEILAIREACKRLRTIDLSGSVLYSTCEPCPMCFSAIHWARIEKVVFGARIMDARVAGFNELPISNSRLKSLGKSPVKIQSQYMRSEALALFKRWKTQYGNLSY